MDNITTLGVIFLWWSFLSPIIISSIICLIRRGQLENKVRYILAATFFGYLSYAIPSVLVALLMWSMKDIPMFIGKIIPILFFSFPAIAAVFTLRYFAIKKEEEQAF